MTPAKKTEEVSKEKKAPVKKTAAPRKKVAAVKAVVPEVVAALSAEDTPVVLAEGKFIYAIGRRKTAIAKTKLWTGGKGEITVNGKPFGTYFGVFEFREALFAPLKAVGLDDKVTVALQVLGGGMRGQAEAARLGISRALIELNPSFRKSLKKLGFLMRDPREKERKKYGLKKARKGSQWAKR